MGLALPSKGIKKFIENIRKLIVNFYWHIQTGDELLEFHQAVVATLHEADEASVPFDPPPAPLPLHIPPTNPLLVHTTEDMQKLQECEMIDMLRFGADQHDENSADNGKPKKLVLCDAHILAIYPNNINNIESLKGNKKKTITWINPDILIFISFISI